MSALTLANLRAFAPHANQSIIQAFLVPDADEIFIDEGINTLMKLCHFMGQTFEETGGYVAMTENLNYSAARLRQVWPSKFPTLAAATAATGSPQKVAMAVYGNRHDLGNTSALDGWTFRGGGLLQLTGRYNYTHTGAKCGIDLVGDPDQIRNPATALRVAASIWNSLGANSPAGRDDIAAVTKLVNGGTTNLAARINATERAIAIFKVAPSARVVSFVSDDTDLGAQQTPYADNGSNADAPVEAATPVATLSSTSQFGTALAAGGGQVPLTSDQVISYQQILKDNNYGVVEIDGNIRSHGTVGAIATLQAQEGLPVTGIVDDATEDAIQNAKPMVVSESRANETAATLRAKGSQTIAAADKASNANIGVATVGGSTLVAGVSSAIGSFNDQADQVTTLGSHIPKTIMGKMEEFFFLHWQVFVLLAVGSALIYLYLHNRSAIKFIISERVMKAATGKDTSC